MGLSLIHIYADLRPNRVRDTVWGLSGTVLSVGMLSIFAVIFVVPLVQNWPYQTQFTLAHVQAVFADSELQTVYLHSLEMCIRDRPCGELPHGLYRREGGCLLCRGSPLGSL